MEKHYFKGVKNSKHKNIIHVIKKKFKDIFRLVLPIFSENCN